MMSATKVLIGNVANMLGKSRELFSLECFRRPLPKEIPADESIADGIELSRHNETCEPTKILDRFRCFFCRILFFRPPMLCIHRFVYSANL